MYLSAVIAIEDLLRFILFSRASTAVRAGKMRLLYLDSNCVTPSVDLFG